MQTTPTLNPASHAPSARCFASDTPHCPTSDRAMSFHLESSDEENAIG